MADREGTKDEQAFDSEDPRASSATSFLYECLDTSTYHRYEIQGIKYL